VSLKLRYSLHEGTPVTIALGILCDDGLVIGADTEQTAPGYFKMGGSKIHSFYNEPWVKEGRKMPGAVCTITGAGPTEYVTAITEKLGEAFLRAVSNDVEIGGIGSVFEDVLKQFHAENILPFSGYPQQPDIWLILGAELYGHRALWVTEKTVIRKTTDYDAYRYVAVGMGNLFAKGLFARLYRPSGMKSAVLLAAHILNEAKTWIPDCGKDTQIVCIKGRDWPLLPEDIAKIEKLLYGPNSLEAVEQKTTHYIFGTKGYSDKSELLAMQDSVRNEFELITKGWSWA